MREIVMSRQFRKDLKLAKKRGLPIPLLKAIVEKLAKDEPLEEKYRDHELSTNFANFRECHVMPDWLLIYRKEEGTLELFLFRTGSHSDLF